MGEPEPDRLEASEDKGGENEDFSVVYVAFSAGVNQETSEALIGAMAECANADAEEVHLLLSTPGGNVADGINLYNLLRGFPFRLVTHNAGSVASIGVAIYLAGEERLACAHSTFTLHGVTFTAFDGQTFEASDLGRQRESVLAEEAKINAILADRTSLDAERLQRAAGTEQTISAEDAVSDGIAHRVQEIQIPPEAHVLPLTFE